MIALLQIPGKCDSERILAISRLLDEVMCRAFGVYFFGPPCMFVIVQFLPREATRSAVLPWQVVRPSVRLSVTLRYRDDIGWNSAKIISRLISLTFSLSADPNMTDLLQREHPKF